jgi:hypothetical protein
MQTTLIITVTIIVILVSLYFFARAKMKNIPTLILLKNGKEINRFVGVKSREFLLRQMNNLK